MAGDTLIVTRLDRFARTVADGVQTVHRLVSRGVIVRVLNMGVIDNTSVGKLILTVMLAFAEYERDMIVERTQTGKAIARAKGIRVDGRPKKFSRDQMHHALSLLDDGNSYTAVERMTGISKSTLIRARRTQRTLDMHKEDDDG